MNIMSEGEALQPVTIRGAPVSADPIPRLVAIFLLAGITNASLLCSPVIASQLGQQLAFTPEQIGWFFSAEYMGYILAGIGGRFLLPRFAWRRVAISALIGVVLGNILAVVVLHDFMTLMIVRLATASCSATLALTTIATANECRHASRAISLNIMGQLTTGVVGLALLPNLFDRFGVASYFLAVALLLLCFAGGIAWLVDGKADRAPTIEGAKGGVIMAPWIAALRYPAILLFYVALGGIWTFAGQLAAATGIDSVTAARMLSGATFAGVIGALAAAAFGKDVQLHLPIIGGFGLLVIGSALLLLGSTFGFLLGIVSIKFAWSLALPFAIALIGRLDGDGRMVADITLLVGIGLATGPSIAGYLIAYDPSYMTMLAAQVVFLAISAISIITMALRISYSSRG